MAELLYRLGRAATQRARLVLIVWIAIFLAVGAAFAVGGGTLATTLSIPGTPTEQVTDQLKSKFPEASGGTGSIVVQTEDGGTFSQDQIDQISARVGKGAALDGVLALVDPFATEAQRAGEAEKVAGGRKDIADARAALDGAGAQLPDDAQDPGVIALEAQRTALEAQSAALEQGASLLDMAAEIRMVSADGSTAVITAVFADPQMDITPEIFASVVALFDEPIAGVGVDFSAELVSGVPSLLGPGEIIGLVVAAFVLIIMLGTLIGAGLPILTALVGVGVGTLGALSLSGVVEMTSVTPILGIMLGLAVGIDYSLFIVNRHRRQLKQGYAVEESIALANGTSGNAVVFAGITVIIALVALNVSGIPFLGLMGTVGALCVAIAVLVAVTLTPALLGLVGSRILSRRERLAIGIEPSETAPKSAVVPAPAQPMSTPKAVIRVLIGIAALLLIAIPALDLRVNLPDGSSEARDTTQFQAFDTVAKKFGEGQNGTLVVVADLPKGTSQEAAMGAQVSIAQILFAQPDVVAVAPIGISEDGTLIAYQVVPAQGPTTESTADLVHTLRDLSPLDGIYEIGVAGSASGNIDISDKLADALPIYLLVVVGLSFIILLLVFRSIFVPIIATGGFILSYFAALGGVVAIYQWGWLSSLFGVETPGPVLNFLPTVLVGILFGLAMDYMLFLGSGMREAYVHGAPARVAIAEGVRAGRSVVTAAAIIMAAVFGGFVFSHSTMIRPIGFALAFGVLLDAFLVRMLIIPALMHLVGDKAWWLPRWLDRILPNIDVEGSALTRHHPRSEQVDAGHDDHAENTQAR